MLTFQGETRVVLYSAQFAESRRFYEQILKLKIISEWDHGGGQLGVIYALGNTYLEVLQGSRDAHADDFYLYSRVENVQELWNGLRDKVEVIDTLQTQPWGHTNFSIKDPNGYKLKFFSKAV